jgi:DnaJ-class molecular chaperone
MTLTTGGRSTCLDCEGQGQFLIQHEISPGAILSEPCGVCNGLGKALLIGVPTQGTTNREEVAFVETKFLEAFRR